jgi:hypothetical protein
MPVKLVERLTELAQDKGVSLNFLVVQCCEYALENLVDNSSEDKK